MRSVLVRGEVLPEELAGLFEGAGVEPQGRAAYAFGATRVAIFVGRKHFFRTNSYLGLVLVASTDGTTQRIDISQAGGGSGLVGMEWGAGDDLEASVYNALAAAVRTKGLAAEPTA
jgi:hypothetical protein